MLDSEKEWESLNTDFKKQVFECDKEKFTRFYDLNHRISYAYVYSLLINDIYFKKEKNIEYYRDDYLYLLRNYLFNAAFTEIVLTLSIIFKPKKAPGSQLLDEIYHKFIEFKKNNYIPFHSLSTFKCSPLENHYSSQCQECHGKNGIPYFCKQHNLFKSYKDKSNSIYDDKINILRDKRVAHMDNDIYKYKLEDFTKNDYEIISNFLSQIKMLYEEIIKNAGFQQSLYIDAITPSNILKNAYRSGNIYK